MSDPAANKQIIKSLYEAMAQGDVRAVVAVFDPEIEVQEPDGIPYGGTYRGIEEVMGMFAKAGPVLDSSNLTVEALTADEDRVVALLRIPLRSGEGEAVVSEHWRLRDGKAVSVRVFWFDPALAAATV